MYKLALSICLLFMSNVVMTFAWYGFLRKPGETTATPMWQLILMSWGLAFMEYCFMVPANRLGSVAFGGPFTLWQLKVIQEVISLSVFTLFMLVCMRSEALRWNHIAGFACLILAVYFIFKK